jgi:hypothetical protein
VADVRSQHPRGVLVTALQLYCGCCGNEIGYSSRSDPDWCANCLPHISRRQDPLGHLSPPWDRTYFATTKRDCPLQVPPRRYA